MKRDLSFHPEELLEGMSDTEVHLIRHKKTEKVYAFTKYNVRGGICDCCEGEADFEFISALSCKEVEYLGTVDVMNFAEVLIKADKKNEN